MITFHFPATIFVNKTTLQDQAVHMKSEAQEVIDELAKNRIELFAVAVESWDVICSAETQLRKLAHHHGVDIEEARAAVLNKNNAPGREYFK